jgi:uncharacterized protein (UPF0264 family)
MSAARAGWSGLLVSVRDAAEAEEACAGGAAIVDVKEPLRGPLGAATAAMAAAVAAGVAGRAPWTLACGELAAGAEAAAASVHATLAALPRGGAGPAAAKVGPAGLAAAEWPEAFATFAAHLPARVEAIAVAYADWSAAAAPAPEAIVAAAAAAGCRTLLIDTFDKSAAGILGLPVADRLPAWIGMARSAGMAVAVAGRLAGADVPRAAALGADVVAVRSAVCRGGRLGRVDRGLVAAAAAALAASAATLPPTALLRRRPFQECQVS